MQTLYKNTSNSFVKIVKVAYFGIIKVSFTKEFKLFLKGVCIINKIMNLDLLLPL